jgi:hypothetical protein
MLTQAISKSEAATRQLELAIRLYFQDVDLIGIHTLAGAAQGILRDLLAPSGASRTITPRQSSSHRSQRNYVVKMVREAIGFLKHADHEPHRILRFNPNWTDFLLYDAIAKHIRLTRTLPHSHIIFLLWVTSKYPTVLLFENLLGEGATQLNELRLLFPRLGGVGGQKCTFLAALEAPPNNAFSGRLMPRAEA